MVHIILRTVIVYFLLLFAMRLMGKRQLAQLDPFEFVLTLLVADLASDPVKNIELPLLSSFAPVFALIALHSILTIFSMSSQGFRKLLTGKPYILIKDGNILEKNLRSLSLNLSDLLEQVRLGGYSDIEDIGVAVLETSGNLSIFPNAENRPLTTKDMNVNVGYETIPLTIILDGVLQSDNLQLIDKDKEWLENILENRNLGKIKKIFFCSLNSKGELFVQKKNEETSQIIQVFEDKGVKW